MASTRPGDELRERALQLRRLAQALGDSEAVTLYRRAGVETWIGPTPQHCLDDLTAARRQMVQATEGLRSAARVLEQRADGADSQARGTVPWGLGS